MMARWFTHEGERASLCACGMYKLSRVGGASICVPPWAPYLGGRYLPKYSQMRLYISLSTAHLSAPYVSAHPWGSHHTRHSLGGSWVCIVDCLLTRRLYLGELSIVHVGRFEARRPDTLFCCFVSSPS